MQGLAEGTLAQEVSDRFVGYRVGLTARIRRSIDAGELRPDTDPNRLIDILMGTLTMPLLFFQDLPAEDEAGTIVDQVLSGFDAHARGENHAA
jgi:hypothetical protein